MQNFELQLPDDAENLTATRDRREHLHDAFFREIVERTLYPLVNEGAKILEEGIAARASDIDVVWVNGYGFPIGKGGPMFWTGLEGAARLVDRLEYWHERTGRAIFQPAPALRRFAETGVWEGGPGAR